MRFKAWIENMLPYNILKAGINYANDPANSVVNSKYYGKGEVKEDPIKIAKFGKMKPSKIPSNTFKSRIKP